jgi:hypothetical protein
MKKSCVLILLLFIAGVLINTIVLAEQTITPSQDGTLRAITSCEKDERTWRVENNTKTKSQWIIEKPFPREPLTEWITPELLEVRLSCGSPCSATMFVNTVAGVSTFFSEVIAVEPSREVVAIVTIENKKAVVKVFRIFASQKPLVIISPEFSPVAAPVSAIEEAHFLESGDLEIEYLSGANYSSKKEVIPDKY